MAPFPRTAAATLPTVTPARVQRNIRRWCPLYRHIGLTVESLGPVVACAVPLRPANVNHLGGMHAAVQWALAEAVGGVAFLGQPELGSGWLAVRDVRIEFVRVARTDLRAEGTFDASAVAAVVAQLEQSGRAEYAVETVLRDAEGTIVTTAVGRYYARR